MQNFMKKRLNPWLPAAFAGLALFLSSCGKDVYDGEVQQWEVPESTLENVLRESHYTPDEFVDALGAPSMTAWLESLVPEALPTAEVLMRANVLSHLPALDREFAEECGASGLAKRRWEIQSYTFSYRSQSVDGREILLSGRVTFPNNTVDNIDHQVKTLSLHTHQALLYSEWAPSENLMFMPLRALWDSAVIEPDLQAWGISRGKEYDACGSSVVQAKQLTDCVVAALEIMRQHGVSLAPDGYTTSWGSSQTASVPLAFARWYETQAPQGFKDQLRLRSTFVGEGVYDLPDVMRNHVFLRPDQIPNNMFFLLSYPHAFSSAQYGGFTSEDFLAPWLWQQKVQLPDGSEVSMPKAYGMGYYDLADAETLNAIKTFDGILAGDMITADGKVDWDSPKVCSWMSCLERHNDLSGWAPKHPIYIVHSREDDMLPYEFAYRCYRRLSDFGQNPQVHMMRFPDMGEIELEGVTPHHVASFLIQIGMACVKEPEDLMKIFKPVK